MSKKCTCALQKGGQGCKNCSRYKLVFLLKNTSKDLKESTPSGKLNNPVVYSLPKEDHYPPQKIFNNMLNRLRKKSKYQPLFQGSNVIYLYDTQTSGEPLKAQP